MSRAKELSQQFFSFLNKYKIALGGGIPGAIAIAVAVTFFVTKADNEKQVAWAKLWDATRKQEVSISSKPEDAEVSDGFERSAGEEELALASEASTKPGLLAPEKSPMGGAVVSSPSYTVIISALSCVLNSINSNCIFCPGFSGQIVSTKFSSFP